jgi:hypothetical protein
MVFNLSERLIDTRAFGDRVVDAGWPDHHAPPLPVLWTLCNTVSSWLKLDARNVAVLHCKAGKGRTGTAIASLLMFQGVFDPRAMGADEAATAALALFARQRSKKAIGVQVPSQKRSVYQFAHVLRAQLIALDRPNVPAGEDGGCGGGGGGGATSRSKQVARDVEDDEDSGTSKNNKKRLSTEAMVRAKTAAGSALFDPPRLQLFRFTMHSIPDYDSSGGLCVGIKVFTAASQGKPSLLLYNSAWHGVQPRRKKSATAKVVFLPEALMVEGDVQVRGYQRGDPKSEAEGQIFRAMFHTAFVPPCGAAVAGSDDDGGDGDDGVEADHSNSGGEDAGGPFLLVGAGSSDGGLGDALDGGILLLDVEDVATNTTAGVARVAAAATTTQPSSSGLPKYRLSLSKEEIDSASKSARFAPLFRITMDFEEASESGSARVKAMRRRLSVDDVLDSTYCGWLKKEGGFVKSWKRRWFVLHRGYLRYFATPESMAMLGEIDLKLYTLQVRGNNLRQSQSCFYLEPTEEGKRLADKRERVYVLMAQDDQDCTRWVNRIAKMWTWAKLQHRPGGARVASDSSSTSGGGKASASSLLSAAAAAAAARPKSVP